MIETLWYRARMNVRALLSRLNPKAYERVRCDRCNGTGFELTNGKPSYRRRGPVPCEKCHGRGWFLVRRGPT